MSEMPRVMVFEYRCRRPSESEPELSTDGNNGADAVLFEMGFSACSSPHQRMLTVFVPQLLHRLHPATSLASIYGTTELSVCCRLGYFVVTDKDCPVGVARVLNDVLSPSVATALAVIIEPVGLFVLSKAVDECDKR